jgi:hypothetical protein
MAAWYMLWFIVMLMILMFPVKKCIICIRLLHLSFLHYLLFIYATSNHRLHWIFPCQCMHGSAMKNGGNMVSSRGRKIHQSVFADESN